MSISGNLEDVPSVDVLQFISLGRRSGTLHVFSRQREATIGLHHGHIVSAWGPGCKKLGKLLVARGLLDEATLAEALEVQRQSMPQSSLAQVLITRGILSESAIRRAVEEQIEEAVCEIVSWDSGTFEFLIDELDPAEDMGQYPGDIIPPVDVDTQTVLLEALRRFDEHKRDHPANDEAAPQLGPSRPGARPQRRSTPRLAAVPHPAATPAPPAPAPAKAPGSRPRLRVVPGGRPGAAGRGDARPAPGHGIHIAKAGAAVPRLQVITRDIDLAARLKQYLPAGQAHVVHVPLRDAGSAPPGEDAPTVLIDVRKGGAPLTAISSIRRSRPCALVIAVIDTNVSLTSVYKAGAIAVLPAAPAALAACFLSIQDSRRDLSDPVVIQNGLRAGFAKLRRVLCDLRSGFLSSTMSLNLMTIIAESAERAILFLVQKNKLTALGAFGHGASGKSLAELTRGMIIPVTLDNAMGDCLADGRAKLVPFDRANLDGELMSILGPPRAATCALLPVLGSDRVIAVIYADNGSRDSEIADFELLELAAAQAGVAFENELLRRQIERTGVRVSA